MVASQVGTGRRGERVGLLGTSSGAMGWPELDEGWDNPIVSWLGGTNQKMGASSWVRWQDVAVCAPLRRKYRWADVGGKGVSCWHGEAGADPGSRNLST